MKKETKIKAAQSAQKVVEKARNKRPGSNKYRDHQTRVLHALQWTEDIVKAKS